MVGLAYHWNCHCSSNCNNHNRDFRNWSSWVSCSIFISDNLVQIQVLVELLQLLVVVDLEGTNIVLFFVNLTFFPSSGSSAGSINNTLPSAGNVYIFAAENGPSSSANNLSTFASFLSVKPDNPPDGNQRWSFNLLSQLSSTSGVYNIISAEGLAIDSSNTNLVAASSSSSSTQQWILAINTGVTSNWGYSPVFTIHQGSQYLTFNQNNTDNRLILAASLGSTSINQLFSIQKQ
jgi:hypothetical protein